MYVYELHLGTKVLHGLEVHPQVIKGVDGYLRGTLLLEKFLKIDEPQLPRLLSGLTCVKFGGCNSCVNVGNITTIR